MTVASVDIAGARSHFSNWPGAEEDCISVYTYGDSVRCAVNTNENSFTDSMGTSHATALMAGIASLFLEEAGTAVQPAVLYELLLNRIEISASGLPQAMLPECAIPGNCESSFGASPSPSPGPNMVSATGPDATLSSGASPPVVDSQSSGNTEVVGSVSPVDPSPSTDDFEDDDNSS